MNRRTIQYIGVAGVHAHMPVVTRLDRTRVFKDGSRAGNRYYETCNCQPVEVLIGRTPLVRFISTR